MKDFDLNVIIVTSGIFIFLVVFFLVTEVIRATRPGCCWLTPPLPPILDVEEGATGEAATPPKRPTPLLRHDSRVTPDLLIRQKRAKSAGRFYAYGMGCRSGGVSRPIRAKTAGSAARRSNGALAFRNNSALALHELRDRKRTMMTTPEQQQETEFNREEDDFIPEDNTSSVSLEDTPVIRHSISVAVATPKPDVGHVETQCGAMSPIVVGHVETQCEAFLPQYTDTSTQTDPDPDFQDRTAVLREVRESRGTGPSPAPELTDTACGPSTIDLICPVQVDPYKVPSPPMRDVTPPPPAPPPSKPPTARGGSRAKSRRKLRSRGMTLHTAMRATSGRRSAQSGSRPSTKQSPTARKSPASIYGRSMRDTPPVEKWHIAAERIYLQQQQRRIKPAKSDKLVLGLKTAISEVKSFTTPPPAVYEVTKAILIIIGEKEEMLTDWRAITNILGRHGAMSPVTRLVNLRGSPLNELQREHGDKILRHITKAEISKVSSGASVLYKWIVYLMNN